MAHAIIVVLVVITLTKADSGVNFSCTQPIPVSPAPPMPTVFQSNSYQSTVEINILDKNYTMVTDEYLDYQNNIGAIIAYRNGVKTQVIYSYRSGEIFQIKLDDNTCMVKNMTTGSYVTFLGPMFNGNGDIRHIFGSSAALNFAANLSYVYTGTGTVRGLPVNIWTTCLPYPNTVGSMQISYYFSQPGWSTAWSQQQMPLRVEIKGQTQSTTFGSATTLSSPRYFHHLYDFINYSPTVDPLSPVFEPPSRVICVNRINTRSLPKLQPIFKYKAEIVNPADERITHYEIWYNQQAKLVREDTRLLNADPQVGVTTMVSEIHDFNTDVRYMIDPKGGCQAMPINSQQSDAKQDMARFQYNQSIIINMKDPSGFFQFNDNYKYVGQRLVRGITCDVFSAVIPNYNAGGTLVDASFEYYFLPQEWNDLSLVGLEADDTDYPVQLVISAPTAQYIRVYNFFDFGTNFVQPDAFDASSCTSPNEKSKVKVTFPGDYNPAALEQWKNQMYFTFASIMQINPLRIGDINIEADADNIYVSAWILGTASSAQFQPVDQPTKEHTDVKVFYNVTTINSCTGLCIQNPDFQCNSFEFCVADNFACRLLNDHTPSGSNAIIANAKDCILYTRPINGPAVKETPVLTAYNNLVQAVQNKQFFTNMPDSMGNTNLYTAINVEIVMGKPIGGKPLPTMPNQFSYRMEQVFSLSNRVIETFVWYDGTLDIVRYDNRDAYSISPYMITYIQDFSQGISYQMNQITESCTVSAIGPGAFEAATGKPSHDGSLVVSMKSPQSLFYLSDSYTFVGQKTVRGILCDVFESPRSDFQTLLLNMTQSSIFKYYFQSTDWDYVTPEGTDITHSQPVMLEVEDTTTGEFITVNFYDFDGQLHSLNYFDTTPCYNNDQRHDFLVIFKGQPYHPTLDQTYNMFLNSAAQLLATQTQLSPIQFQQMSVTTDGNQNVYMFVTALGNVPPIVLFTSVMTVGLNTSVSAISADTVEDCAAACTSMSSFICYSFDWCGASGCLLGQKHQESEGDSLTTTSNITCQHYTRTENATMRTIDVSMIYKVVTDYVYNDMFHITVTLPDNTNKTYIATDIRDDLEIPSDPTDTSGSLLRNYVVTPNSQFVDSAINQTTALVSITDCALACHQENTFDCQSFDYSFTTGQCRLTSLHPDESSTSMPAIIKTALLSNIYSKFYTMDYTRNSAEVFTTAADKRLLNVNSDEMCARACTTNTDFRCESFEICEDGSCNLRKTHMIQAKPSDLQNASGCTHYSRNHFYDYVERDYKTLNSMPNSKSVIVDKTQDCANLCSVGELLPSCASFVMCDIDGDQGASECTLTLMDPTVSKDIGIVSTEGCNLYTRANSQPIINPVNPVTVRPTRSSTTTTTTTTKTATSTAAVAAVKTVTSAATSASQNSGASGRRKSCTSQASGNSTDTGPRVGIAFGTLFLGLLLGGMFSFLFMKFHYSKKSSEDAQMLTPWGN